jgi:hypothetical protein
MNKLFKNTSAILMATLFCAAVFISCEEKEEKTTTTTTTEEAKASPEEPMDSGATRPVITEN